MKSFAKLVTGVLLAALVATPMFAAIPCRPAVDSKACCGGAECPMMAKTMTSRVGSRKGTNDVPQPCCKVTSHFLVAVVPQRAPEILLNHAVLRESFTVFFAPVMQGWDSASFQIGLRSLRRSQSDLCTFLI